MSPENDAFIVAVEDIETTAMKDGRTKLLKPGDFLWILTVINRAHAAERERIMKPAIALCLSVQARGRAAFCFR